MNDSIDNDDYLDDDFEETKSKSQVKREMLALQDLGAVLVELTPEQQAKIPLSDTLRDTVVEARKIKSNIAKKRHMQFLGKLLRSADTEAIEEALSIIQNESHRAVKQHHAIEQWRDDLLANKKEDFERFVDLFPHTDRQQLRQLIRSALKEKSQQKPPAHSRKLFRFLRDTVSEPPQEEN